MKTKLQFHKYILPAAFLSLAAGLPACKKFVNVPLKDQPTVASDPNLATNLVTGVYHTLLFGDVFGNGDIHGISYVAVTDIMSDDAAKGSTVSDQPQIGDLDNFTHTSSNQFCNYLWKGYYFGIGQVNHTIDALNTSSLDDSTKNRYMGEVRFIRAYYYFNLVRMFGEVPMVVKVPDDATEINTNDAFNVRRPTSVIYDSVIVPDLAYAMAHTPLKSGAATGRVTKGAAEALLAKVYLYRKDWQKVFDLTNDVMTSGQYHLEPDYANVWRPAGNNGVESIFEVETGDFGSSNLGVQEYCIYQGPRVGGLGGWTDLGYGFNNPTPTLVNAYDAADVRKSSTIIFIDQSPAHVGTYLWDGFRIPSADSVQNLTYNYKAYASENTAINPQYLNSDREHKQKNLHILRYAEVLLMNAEAANELGNTGAAQDALNTVRARAGLPATTAGGGPDMRLAVWNERHVELAMEQDRFWDIVRQGRAADIMHAAGKANFVAGKNELLPIPDVQIALSGGKLTQNPGY